MDNVGIGGFIITGNVPKQVLLRAIGPSLAQSGVPDALADPVLELHGPGAFATITNDNWRDDPAQEAAILATGIPPTNDLESAIDATLNPGAYTAVIRARTTPRVLACLKFTTQPIPFRRSWPTYEHTGVCRHWCQHRDCRFPILGNHSGNDRDYCPRNRAEP